MSAGSEAVKRWRNNAKARMIQAFGGKCCICGYDKCDSALEFHHLDPSEKETTFGKLRANIKSWEKIVEEMRKCVMLCSNCHREVHAGLVDVPENASRLDEDIADYRTAVMTAICPVCNKTMSAKNKTCSLKCSGSMPKKKNRYKGHDLNALYAQLGSFSKIGEMFGVSGTSIKKQIYKKNSGLAQR